MSGEKNRIRLWLAAIWPRRERAKELGRQYAALGESSQLVLADLSRVCLVHDEGFSRNPYEHAFNAGKRAVFRHIETMMDMDEGDIRTLRQESEHE